MLRKWWESFVKQIKRAYSWVAATCVRGYQAAVLKSKDTYGDLQDLMKKDPRPRMLKKLPIYLVVGSQNSGKKTLLEQAGLRILPASYFGHKAEQMVAEHSHYQWHFTDQAIYIVCGDAVMSDHQHIIKLVKFLRRRRKHKPLSGLLFSFAMPELMLAKHDDRRHLLKNLADQIQLMHRFLKTSIPLYCMMTKLDLVSGFSAFFNHLSQEELMQLWGVTFPLAITSEVKNLESYFQTSYQQLISRLDEQLSYTLDIEKNEEKRLQIVGFPQQMQCFQTALQGFIGEIFAGLSHHKFLQLRGIYFTSAVQTGEPYNFIAHAMQNQFDMHFGASQIAVEGRESYFIYNVFQSVILQECDYVGYSLSMNKYRRWLYKGICVGIPTLVFATGWAFHRVYKDIKLNNVEISNHLDFYQHAKKSMDIHDPSEQQALKLLDPLLQSEQSLKSIQLLSWLFISNDAYLSSLSAAMDRALVSQYVPRVAAQLENTLGHDQLDTNTLYATLKGYLAFSPQDDTPASSMIAPMKLIWQKSYAPDSAQLRSLTYYLNRSAHLDITALPIDRQLVNKMRLALQQVVPSDRAYALLLVRSMASNLPDVVISSLAGESFSSVFTIPNKQDSVPALYTHAGYAQIFAKHSKDIAQQVSEDNKAIGLKSGIDRTESLQSITNEMQIKYNAAYLQAWQGVVKHIAIKPIHNLQQARQAFTVLSGVASPLNRLLLIVKDNTSTVSGQHIDVEQQFNQLNNFSSMSLSGSLLMKVDAAIVGINKIVTQITLSADPSQSSLNYIEAFPKKDAKDPFKALAALSKQAPQPVQQWLQQLSQQAWQAIANQALVALNQKWQSQVVTNYQQHLAGHFPVDAHAQRPLSIANFTAFYKQGGVYDKFYKQYLAAFVDQTNADAFKPKLYDGYHLNFSAQELRFFTQSSDIMQDYFGNGAKPQVVFALKPVSLDKEAAEFNLSIGEQNFGYAHGPQEVSNYQWPFDLNNASADLTVTGFNQDAHHLSAEGPWALFKIFSHAQVNKTENGYLMEYRLGGLHLAWLCDTDTPLRALNLSDFRAFHFPQQFTIGEQS